MGRETFCFRKSGITPADGRSRSGESGWYTLVRTRSGSVPGEMPLMQVAPLHCYLSDFYGQNLLRCSGPTAYSLRHVSRNTPDGYIDLTGNVLTVKEGDAKRVRIIAEDELADVLGRYFQMGDMPRKPV